jgi:hypothetical protein
LLIKFKKPKKQDGLMYKTGRNGVWGRKSGQRLYSYYYLDELSEAYQ